MNRRGRLKWVFVSAGSFLAGAAAGVFIMLATYAFPPAGTIFSGGGNGVTVSGSLYSGQWWDEDGATILRFHDRKNDHSPMREVFPYATRDIQDLYNDETLTVISVDRTFLYLHHRDRESQSVEMREFAHPVVAVMPDKERFISYRINEDGSELVLMRMDGERLFGYDEFPRYLEPREFRVFDNGTKVAFTRDGDPFDPRRLFVWDLAANRLFEARNERVVALLKENKTPYVDDRGRLLISPGNIDVLEDQRHVNNELGIFFSVPWNWAIYGNDTGSAIPGLLESLSLMPGHHPFKSVEEQDVLFLKVYDTSIETEYDAPGSYLANDDDETWEDVVVNGMPGTKVTSSRKGAAVHYLFRRGDLLYVIASSNPDHFETLLSPLTIEL